MRRVWESWRRRPAVVALLVALSVGAAVVSSLRIEKRFAATASYKLFTIPGVGIRPILEGRAREIGEYAFGGEAPEPIIDARPGAVVVRVTVEGPSRTSLLFTANVYTSELVAWEIGPRQREIQRRYRRMLTVIDQTAEDDVRLPARVRELAVVQQMKVTDSQYTKARGTRQVAGPRPLMDAGIALPVALLFAAALSLALDRIDRGARAVASVAGRAEARKPAARLPATTVQLRHRLALRVRALNRGETLGYAALLGLAIFSNSRVAIGQFTGGDEPTQLAHTSELSEVLRNWSGLDSLHDIWKIFSLVEHPPLRYILSLPGVLLLPGTEFGLRLGAIVVSLVMTYLVVRLGTEVGGRVVGFTSGLLVAASGVYNWTSMAFGWSVIVVAVIQVVRLLRRASLDLSDRKERKKAYVITAWLCLAFLTNTGSIALIAGVVVLYVLSNYPRPRNLVALSPLAGFCGLYYAYLYLFAPWALPKYFGYSGPVPQVAHADQRLEVAQVNVTSFLENLQGLNAYFFPFAGWALLALSLAYLGRNCPRLLLVVGPFMLVWSFFLTINTQQYFLLAVIAIVPFGVQGLFEIVGTRAAGATACVAVLAFVTWHFFVFVRPYDEAGFPSHVLSAAYAKAERYHNVVVPYSEIDRDVSRLLAPGERYVANVGESLPQFYLNRDRSGFFDQRYAGAIGPAPYELVRDGGRECFKLHFDASTRVRVAITRQILCPEDVDRRLQYRGALITVYVLDQTLAGA